MKKTPIPFGVLRYPLPLTLVGALVDGRPNYLVAAYCAVLSHEPPVVSVTLHRGHFTVRGIEDHGVFSVNLPSRGQLGPADRCGVVSGRDADKSGLFTPFYGALAAAPLARECPLNLECRVLQTVDLGASRVFLGRVEGVYADAGLAENGPVGFADLEPVVLLGADYHAWALGARLGSAGQVTPAG